MCVETTLEHDHLREWTEKNGTDGLPNTQQVEKSKVRKINN